MIITGGSSTNAMRAPFFHLGFTLREVKRDLSDVLLFG